MSKKTRSDHDTEVEVFERTRICAKHLYHAYRQMQAIASLMKPEGPIGEVHDPNQLRLFEGQEEEDPKEFFN